MSTLTLNKDSEEGYTSNYGTDSNGVRWVTHSLASETIASLEKQNKIMWVALNKIATDGCDNKYTRIAAKAAAEAN